MNEGGGVRAEHRDVRDLLVSHDSRGRFGSASVRVIESSVDGVDVDHGHGGGSREEVRRFRANARPNILRLEVGDVTSKIQLEVSSLSDAALAQLRHSLFRSGRGIVAHRGLPLSSGSHRSCRCRNSLVRPLASAAAAAL